MGIGYCIGPAAVESVAGVQLVQHVERVRQVLRCDGMGCRINRRITAGERRPQPEALPDIAAPPQSVRQPAKFAFRLVLLAARFLILAGARNSFGGVLEQCLDGSPYRLALARPGGGPVRRASIDLARAPVPAQRVPGRLPPPPAGAASR
jgi:hypothetical protein